jgi:hypothetical protein
VYKTGTYKNTYYDKPEQHGFSEDVIINLYSSLFLRKHLFEISDRLKKKLLPLAGITEEKGQLI